MTSDEFRKLLQRLADAWGGLDADGREYLVKGPSDQERFTSVDGKEWRWHAGNYP